MADHSQTLLALKDGADLAMRRGDPRGAGTQFERALELAPRRIDLLMGLAACRRAIGDPGGALAAVEAALAVEPRLFPALLMKGSLLEALGRPAAEVYGAALKVAPSEDAMAEPTRRALAHARESHARHAAELAAWLRREIGFGDLHSTLDRRAEAFIEAAVGRRKVFHQEPVQFCWPGMPAIEFYERDEFPWLEALEERTPAIREEALAVWAEGSPELTPYVQYPAGAPVDQWADLNHSLKWSAFHLWLDGGPVEAHAARCPATMAALELVDRPRVPGRSPAAMYSILRPRTRIPPHTGIANTRLVLHLPLIVPEGCGFRVGGETRAWREGEAWVFDDTIEHEAWNDSEAPRAVLICDVWSPRLSGEEREIVARITAAFDHFNGPADETGL